MVIRLSLILFFLPFSIAQASDLRFQVRYSKPRLFRGEQVLAQFVLKTQTLTHVEVEVAKFPEFRNFWSENLSLRQGPLSFNQDSALELLPYLERPTLAPTPGWRETIVGAYLITPMVEGPLPTVEPMRILVKPMGGTQFGEETLVSEGAFPPIQPLPPPPATEVFGGAVGSFQISPERREIPFRSGEPASLRFLVTGEGNFPEITDLNLKLGPGMEILAKRVFQQATQPTGSKIIDYTLKITATESRRVGATFTYFEPARKAYQIWNSPPITFTLLPPIVENVPEIPEAPEEETPFTEEFWAAVLTSGVIPWLVGLFGTFGLGLAYVLFRRQWRRLRTRYLNSWAHEKKVRAATANTLYQKGEWKHSLTLTRELAVEILRRRLQLPSPELTAQQLLQRAESQGWPETELAPFRKIIQLADQSYGPSATPPATDPRPTFQKIFASSQ